MESQFVRTFLMAKTLLCPESLLSLDLSGKVYLVTGGNSGIGYETVTQLARQGAKVVLACRRTSAGNHAKAKIKALGVRGSVEVMELDLSRLESVRAFAGNFLRLFHRLDGLVNNAGVMNTPKGTTQDGFETQFGTNHLGHFLLTELLLDCIRATPDSRIVNLSSCFHDRAMGREGQIDFEDLNFERKKYDGWEAYAQSKLANLLHARALAKQPDNQGVISVSVHPGWVRTGLISHSMPLRFQDFWLKPILKLMGMIEPWEGAQSTLYALLSPEVPAHNGGYFSQVGIYRTREAGRGGWPLHSPNPHANDETISEKLYQVSLSLVGFEKN
jgi:NAD(P)-dependent dehydrogenase (short-subunit alcohol dehydrogenase family)